MPDSTGLNLDGAQTGDVKIEDVAGNDVHKTTINNLADLPPGLATWAADQQELSLRMIDALDRIRLQVDRSITHLRGDIDLYRATDASERKARQRENDARLLWLTVAVVVLTAVIVAVIADRIGLILGAGAVLAAYYLRTR